MPRRRHSKPEIEAALVEAEARGWRIEPSGGHAKCWGVALCPEATRKGCRMSIQSTPRNAQNHGKQIRKQVAACDHRATPAPERGEETV